MIGSFLLKVIATSFQSVLNCDVCSRRELNAERRVVGGTAVCQGLLEPMT